jgi:uncharacterized membrane protein YtjA (UPF0391 family)
MALGPAAEHHEVMKRWTLALVAIAVMAALMSFTGVPISAYAFAKMFFLVLCGLFTLILIRGLTYGKKTTDP